MPLDAFHMSRQRLRICFVAVKRGTGSALTPALPEPDDCRRAFPGGRRAVMTGSCGRGHAEGRRSAAVMADPFIILRTFVGNLKDI